MVMEDDIDGGSHQRRKQTVVACMDLVLRDIRWQPDTAGGMKPYSKKDRVGRLISTVLRGRMQW